MATLLLVLVVADALVLRAARPQLAAAVIDLWTWLRRPVPVRYVGRHLPHTRVLVPWWWAPLQHPTKAR